MDLIGINVGNLVVVSFSRSEERVTSTGKNYKLKYYNCLCECGQFTEVERKQLISSKPTKSCGCARITANSFRRENLTGIRFGRLLATERSIDKNNSWDCICDCGSKVSVVHAKLKNGNSTSCGCKRLETCSAILTERHELFREQSGIPRGTYVKDENIIQRGKFNTFSKVILSRDNYTCAWCSQYGGELNVHHIETWVKSPSLRFDPKNLVTLCRVCHVNVHQGNFHGPLNFFMNKLLQGYGDVIGDLAYCARIPLTPN